MGRLGTGGNGWERVGPGIPAIASREEEGGARRWADDSILHPPLPLPHQLCFMPPLRGIKGQSRRGSVTRAYWGVIGLSKRVRWTERREGKQEFPPHTLPPCLLSRLSVTEGPPEEVGLHCPRMDWPWGGPLSEEEEQKWKETSLWHLLVQDKGT